MSSTMELLPGTEVHARGLRWEVVSTEILGKGSWKIARNVLASDQTTYSPSGISKRWAKPC